MAACNHEGGDCGGGDGGDNGVALLVDVDPAVPAAIDLGWGEHAAAAAHVAEGCLAGAVGATAGDAGGSGDGAAGSPGFGGGLVAGVAADGIGLAGVSGDVGVDECDYVGANGGLHDIGEWNGGGILSLEGLNGDQRASCCCSRHHHG